MNTFLIYGAYGYSGKLIAYYAKEKGLSVILGGRNEAKIKALANELDVPFRVFGLEDQGVIEEALGDVVGVMHCAGPFIKTSDQMAEACISTGTHYLDITGEWAVFEWLNRKDLRAKRAGVMLLPGTGVDVVPSDCLSMHMKERMPDAHTLELAIRTVSDISHGTAMTAVEALGKDGFIRENGEFVPVPLAFKSRKFDFEGKEYDGATMPLAEVSTSYHSTGIPNINVYYCIPWKTIKMVRRSNTWRWLMGREFVKNIIRSRIRRRPAGPSEVQRKEGKTRMYAEVINDAGEVMVSIYNGREGYTITAEYSVLLMEKVLNGNVKPGFQTPSLAYGSTLALEIAGATITDIK